MAERTDPGVAGRAGAGGTDFYLQPRSEFPQSPIPITEPDGSEATYGEKLVSMGGGRFAVSAPLMDVNIGARLLIRYQIDGGFVGIRDQDGLLIAGTAAPRSTLRPPLRFLAVGISGRAAFGRRSGLGECIRDLF